MKCAFCIRFNSEYDDVTVTSFIRIR